MIIYKCQNKISGKIYIGQTIKSLEERKLSHIIASKKGKSKFYKALQSYGFENFDWSIIDTANTKEELDEKEKYYIVEYNSIKNGYNMVDGGTGGYNEHAVAANKLKKGKKWEDIYSSAEYVNQKKETLKLNYDLKLRKYNFSNLSKKDRTKFAKLGNNARKNSDYVHSDETKKKISNSQIGITYEQRYGSKKANKLKNKISEATKEAMKSVDRELLGKKSVEARKPFWDNKHKQQKEKIIELKNKNISVKKIIAELNISTPTYYKLWNEIKANTI
jgi:group I intron endonuclease